MRRVPRLVLFVLLTCAGSFAQTSQYRHPEYLIETTELRTILANPGVRVLDARLPQEYRQAHLPGAINLPAPATDDRLASGRGYPLDPLRAKGLFRAAGINNASRVIVYDDEGNRFATWLFYVLDVFGHHRVQVLNGGIRKWYAEGLPLTAEVSSASLGDFTPEHGTVTLVTSQWIEQHLEDPGVRLVDARTPAEYTGLGGPGIRLGHIPGAVNIEWTRLITPGAINTFLAPPALERVFSDAGVTPEKTVVAYCQVGIRASEVYFALRQLGYSHVRLYAGSWEDWSSNPNLPVEK